MLLTMIALTLTSLAHGKFSLSWLEIVRPYRGNGLPSKRVSVSLSVSVVVAAVAVAVAVKTYTTILSSRLLRLHSGSLQECLLFHVEW